MVDSEGAPVFFHAKRISALIIFAPMKKLPIGLQDLPGLISDGYLFVDKTEQIHRLMQAGKYLFLSRPRRFGKSLLVSTLHEIFRGNKALFKGLWIEDKIDWAPYPVIRVDFNAIDYRVQSLEHALSRQMDDIASRHGLEIPEEWTSKDKFSHLIETLGSGDKKVVVLIDEYDKAITDFLGEDEERIPENVRTLKNFYSTLKSLDRCIHFVFITGVSKYGRVSIFSDLNNLNDVSTHPDFAVLLGWTQEEMERYFDNRLSDLARHFNLDRADLLEKIRAYYNGYSWDGEHRVYNPYSLLNFFHHRTFRNFWFTTGTPTFLTKLLRQQLIPAYELENFRANDFMVESADVHHVGLPALMLQTGYFTIKKITLSQDLSPLYHLGYPNREVRLSFLQNILAAYLDRPVDVTDVTLTQHMRRFLTEGDLPNFFALLSSIFASVPYQITRTEESYFHSVTHVVLALTAHVVHSEIPTNQGRMDAVLDAGERVYIFEFKLRDSADDALAQIREHGYPERFRAAGKPLTLVGVAFDTEAKNVREWKAEEG
jgi:hypothetical protein